MNIPVEIYATEVEIPVVIDGDCNHAGAEMETVSNMTYTHYEGRYVPDDSYKTDVLVCKCGAWYEEDYGFWENEK